MNVVVIGINGSMGKYIADVLDKRDGLNLIGGIDLNKSYNRYEIREYDNFENIDVIVDFSNKTSIDYLKRALNENIKVISGTTGFSDLELNELKKISKINKTSFIWTPNYAKGASYMYRIMRSLKKAYELDDLIETHKIGKKDSPSGTALELSKGFNQLKVQSVRVKDSVASHEAVFSSTGEKIKIIHEISNKNAFIIGFLNAFDRLITDDYICVVGLNEYFLLNE